MAEHMDPIDEFIEMAVRHVGAHHCTGPIQSDETHWYEFQRGSQVWGAPELRLQLPTLAHLKHGPSAVEEAERHRELERIFRSDEYSDKIANYVAGPPKRDLPPLAGGSRQYFEELLVPTMTADQTAVTGTTEAALWPVNPFSATSAYQMQPGQKYKVHAFGVLTTPASTPGTLTVTPRWGTSSSGTTFGASIASAALTTSLTNVPWYMDSYFICRGPTTSSATAVWGGTFTWQSAASSSSSPGELIFGGTTATIDITTAQGLYFGVTLGSASDSITVRDVSVMAVN